MTRIIGTIMRGDNKAHINCVILRPQLAQHCKEITTYGKDGTINLQLAHSFPTGGNADCWTPRITWKPNPITGLGELRAEAFGLIKVKFEFPLDRQTYNDVWIILPEGVESTYTDDKVKVEFIAAGPIDGVAYGKQGAIHFDHTPAVPKPPWFSRDSTSYKHLLTIASILRPHPFCNDCLRELIQAATVDEIEHVTNGMSVQECFVQATDICVRCPETKLTMSISVSY